MNLSRNELTKGENGATFPEELKLTKNRPETYNIAAGSAKTRKLIISVEKRFSKGVTMVYTPAEGQERQTWPGDSKKADKVTFFIYDQGGTIKFTNTARSQLTLAIVE